MDSTTAAAVATEGYMTLTTLFPLLVGGLIVPIVAWIKKLLPMDFPLKPVMATSILAILGVWGLSKAFAPEMTMNQIITFTLGSQVLSQYFREGVQTAKKLKNGGVK